jgi:hypothetical protein
MMENSNLTNKTCPVYGKTRTCEQPAGSKRRYTRRNRRGRAGDYFPPQLFIEPELGEQGVPKEESSELGQLASEAERRAAQS